MEPVSLNITHYIQLAVAPVFLIAGVAGLLNVLTGRLARVMDKLDKIDSFIQKQLDVNASYKLSPETAQRREFLVLRMQNTNWAIFLCTSAGLMVALVIMTVFLGAIFSFDAGYFISTFFVLAMFCLVIALILFLKEIYYTSSSIRNKKRDIKSTSQQ
jgi:CBS domain containing-hemolysin-like protein